METIQTYLDNIFSSYPQTPAVLNAKTELYNLMEDKYTELKAQGKSENETIGVVISEFGNIEELMSELNVTPMSESESTDIISVNREDAISFIQAKKKEAAYTSIGIAVIFLGVILFLLCTAFIPQIGNSGFDLEAAIDPTDRQGMFCVIPLFLCIAAGASLFIISENTLNKHKQLSDVFVSLSDATRSYLKECHNKFIPSYTAFLTIGIVLCILSPLSLFGMIGFLGESDTAGVLSVSVMLLLLTIGIFFISYVNTEKEAYEILLQEGEFTANGKKARRFLHIIAPVYWSAVVLIYLTWSFTGNQWQTTWIVWPIAAVLYSFVKKIIVMVLSSSKKKISRIKKENPQGSTTAEWKMA